MMDFTGYMLTGDCHGLGARVLTISRYGGDSEKVTYRLDPALGENGSHGTVRWSGNGEATNPLLELIKAADSSGYEIHVNVNRKDGCYGVSEEAEEFLEKNAGLTD
jgi:hypothetical protein